MSLYVNRDCPVCGRRFMHAHGSPIVCEECEPKKQPKRQMTKKHKYEWKPRGEDSQYGIDWRNIDLGSREVDFDLIDGMAFEDLLLQIACNCPEITRDAVEHEFLEALQSRIDDAKWIFEANIDNIVSKAKAERSES